MPWRSNIFYWYVSQCFLRIIGATSVSQCSSCAAGNYLQISAVASTITSTDLINAGETDANGNVYFAGSFTGSISFGAITLTSNGDHDAFLVKYDKSMT